LASHEVFETRAHQAAGERKLNFSESWRSIATRHSIGHRLAIYILLFSSVVTLLFTALELGFDYHRDVQVIESEIAQVEKSYSVSLAHSLWVTSKGNLKLQLDGISRQPDMQYLEVRSDTNEVLARVGKPQSRHTIVRNFPLYHTYRGKEIYLGKLHVEATLVGVYQRLKAKVVLILITQGIKTFLVSLFILLLFQHLLGRHLIRIARHEEVPETESVAPVLTLDRQRKPDAAVGEPDELDELDVLVGRINDKNRRLERAWQDLQRSEERFRQLFAQAGAGLALVDSASGRFLQANPRFCEMLGYAQADLAALDFQSLTHPEDLQESLDNMARLKSGQQDGFEMEKRYIHKAGHTVWAKLTVSAMRGQDGSRDTHIAVIQEITRRKRAEAATQAMLAEKTALLNEVHHRVKNNLQVISSLLRLESARSGQDETRLLLKSMQSRIQSMALLHETLYRAGTFAAVDLGAYLKQLAAQAFRTLQTPEGGVRLEVDVTAVQVSMDQATPCGLLVNELISNALKHGFPDGRAGEVRIALHRVGTDEKAGGSVRRCEVRLCVSNTGVGLPPDFAQKRQSSLGLQLVTSLSRQLGGELVVGPGATFSLVFAVADPDLKREFI
jgi:PAS domain S-box-containing protein